ncbi:IBR domain-containing protein [Prunus dulcis]|uniref:IBR domain-containing protein n=1 Tax=Prunus dulcis TaxID=3755 RepID=A0A4Y1R165_PRUDU|nr:IBR domain-containing protein [Prunus dulcis]
MEDEDFDMLDANDDDDNDEDFYSGGDDDAAAAMDSDESGVADYEFIDNDSDDPMMSPHIDIRWWFYGWRYPWIYSTWELQY